jgi:hypothetical protein
MSMPDVTTKDQIASLIDSMKLMDPIELQNKFQLTNVVLAELLRVTTVTISRWKLYYVWSKQGGEKPPLAREYPASIMQLCYFLDKQLTNQNQ